MPAAYQGLDGEPGEPGEPEQYQDHEAGRDAHPREAGDEAIEEQIGHRDALLADVVVGAEREDEADADQGGEEPAFAAAGEEQPEEGEQRRDKAGRRSWSGPSPRRLPTPGMPRPTTAAR